MAPIVLHQNWLPNGLNWSVCALLFVPTPPPAMANLAAAQCGLTGVRFHRLPPRRNGDAICTLSAIIAHYHANFWLLFSTGPPVLISSRSPISGNWFETMSHTVCHCMLASTTVLAAGAVALCCALCLCAVSVLCIVLIELDCHRSRIDRYNRGPVCDHRSRKRLLLATVW